MKARLVLVATRLTACQSWQGHTPEQPPPHRGAGVEHMGMHGQDDMCRLHQQMMSARTPEARQAIMEHAMPDMPRESREQHLQMMQQMCH
ncbi:hypothetical protein [Massilia sp.]|uniref:hypothetical protein n=1 Tax=Massilia sp. TaxID=1882437 RepID=UPI00352DE1EE